MEHWLHCPGPGWRPRVNDRAEEAAHAGGAEHWSTHREALPGRSPLRYGPSPRLSPTAAPRLSPSPARPAAGY